MGQFGALKICGARPLRYITIFNKRYIFKSSILYMFHIGGDYWERETTRLVYHVKPQLATGPWSRILNFLFVPSRAKFVKVGLR